MFIADEFITDISGAAISGPNFSGRPSMYGNRNPRFGFELSPEKAAELEAKGWRVNWSKKPENAKEDWVSKPYFNVEYQFRKMDGTDVKKYPVTKMITCHPDGTCETAVLDESQLHILDNIIASGAVSKFDLKVWPSKKNAEQQYANPRVHKLYVYVSEDPIDANLREYESQFSDKLYQ